MSVTEDSRENQTTVTSSQNFLLNMKSKRVTALCLSIRVYSVFLTEKAACLYLNPATVASV